uniref:VP7 n=1 Tax=viral metagenome TaxID=1070528 RepID=A0A2V0RNP1_9ZZZZ
MLNRKLTSTKLRSFQCGIVVSEGDKRSNVDPTRILLRKVNANVFHVSENDIQIVANRYGMTREEVMDYISSVCQTPFLKGNGIEFHPSAPDPEYQDLYMGYSGKLPSRLSMNTIPTLFGIHVPKRTTLPEVFPGTAFRRRTKLPQCALMCHEFLINNPDIINTDFSYSKKHKNNTEFLSIVDVNEMLDSMDDQIIFSDGRRSRFRACTYHPEAVTVFRAIVLSAGTGKTTLAKRYPDCVDIDDVFSRYSDDRTTIQELVREEAWDALSELQTDMLVRYLEEFPSEIEKTFLIHHCNQFKPRLSPIILGVYKCTKTELMDEIKKRILNRHSEDDDSSLVLPSKPDYILGGRRGSYSVPVKIAMLKRYGTDLRYYVDGAEPGMFPGYTLPEGFSVHAFSGPAAATYGAFSHANVAVETLEHKGKKYAVVKNDDLRTAGKGNVTDHFITALEHLIIEKHDIIEFDNSWVGNSWKTVPDHVGVIWSKQTSTPSHVPHQAMLSRQSEVPDGTFQIINDQVRSFKSFVNELCDAIVKMKELGFSPIHVWLQGKLVVPDDMDAGSRPMKRSFRNQMDAIYEELDLRSSTKYPDVPVYVPKERGVKSNISETMRLNWDTTNVIPQEREDIAKEVSSLIHMRPYVLPSNRFHGMGSVVTSCHAVFGLGRSVREVTEQAVYKLKHGTSTSGHLLASCLAHFQHMIWYVYEVFVNSVEKRSIYLFPFDEPEGGEYHTKADYEYTLRLLEKMVEEKPIPHYAKLHVGLLSSLFSQYDS